LLRLQFLLLVKMLCVWPKGLIVLYKDEKHRAYWSLMWCELTHRAMRIGSGEKCYLRVTEC